MSLFFLCIIHCYSCIYILLFIIYYLLFSWSNFAVFSLSFSSFLFYSLSRFLFSWSNLASLNNPIFVTELRRLRRPSSDLGHLALVLIHHTVVWNSLELGRNYWAPPFFRSLDHLHCLFVSLLCTACFAYALHCADLLDHSLASDQVRKLVFMN